MNKTKIVAPLRPCKDYNAIINSRADEFYIGIIPDYWKNIYGGIGLNRRDFSSPNLSTFEELKNVVKLVHDAKKKISITLNNHFYTDEQNELLKRFLGDCIECNIDNFIGADPGLMYMIRSLYKDMSLHVSGEAGCYSGYDIKFFNQFGVNRIIFPRDITLQEMYDAITSANLNIEYEAFIFGPRCTYSGAYCTMSHGIINGPSFCGYKLKHAVLRCDGKDLSDEEIKKLNLNFMDRNRWANNDSDQFADSCGICSVENLENIGVRYLKIVGREFSLETNLHNINIVSNGIDRIKENKLSQENKCFTNDNSYNSGFACYYINKTITTFIPRDIMEKRQHKNNQQKNKDVEYCILINHLNIDNLKSKISWLREKYRNDSNINTGADFNFNRIYFGNEFCENKLPNLPETQEIVKFCDENSLGFSLLLPPMSSQGFKKVIDIINGLKIEAPFEIICNSWGAIDAFKGVSGAEIVLGRLLNKVKHDPFIANNMEAIIKLYKERYDYPLADDDEIKRYLCQSNVNNKYFDALLNENDIMRVETDIPYQILNENHKKSTLYYPIQFVTMGRYCFWSGIDVAEKKQKFKPNSDCKQFCNLYFSKIKSFDNEIKLFSNGNTVFSKQTYDYYGEFDRYVLEDTLPI
jgi:collagenase-like PrtC family protease